MAGTSRISANAIGALKEALTAAFWFKRDLYDYAKAAVGGNPTFLAGIEWTSSNQYKRDSVSLFVDRLVREQDDHQDVLLALLVDVAAMTDFPQLRRTEDPEPKIAAARDAVARLRAVVRPYERELMERQAARERIDGVKQAAQDRRATVQRLTELKTSYLEILQMQPVPRGFALEKLLTQVFEVFDLDPRGSFRVVGEQIDGGFGLDSEHFLLEAKWEKTRPPTTTWTSSPRRCVDAARTPLGCASPSTDLSRRPSISTLVTVRPSCSWTVETSTPFWISGLTYATFYEGSAARHQ